MFPLQHQGQVLSASLQCQCQLLHESLGKMGPGAECFYCKLRARGCMLTMQQQASRRVSSTTLGPGLACLFFNMSTDCCMLLLQHQGHVLHASFARLGTGGACFFCKIRDRCCMLLLQDQGQVLHITTAILGPGAACSYPSLQNPVFCSHMQAITTKIMKEKLEFN